MDTSESLNVGCTVTVPPVPALSAGRPSVDQGRRMPRASAIVASTSVLRTFASLTRPRCCPGALMNSGMLAICGQVARP